MGKKKGKGKKSYGRNVEMDFLQRGILINVLGQRSATLKDGGGVDGLEAYKIHKVMSLIRAEEVEEHQRENGQWLTAEQKKWQALSTEEKLDVDPPRLTEEHQRGDTKTFFIPRQFFQYVRDLLKNHKGWATDFKSLNWIMDVFSVFLLDDYMESLLAEDEDDDDDIDWDVDETDDSDLEDEDEKGQTRSASKKRSKARAKK